MQTYLNALNYLNACHVYDAECVSKIKTLLSVIFYSIYGTVLSSSNQKYESLTIV